ncbi:GNAT family N-acetyltransferase [Pseudomonas xantholysinigenes]|uniref:GNAT family N-acetyltransferase n=1 Tax=Pseudomonas xantholysinigenes TaxID=2745490 RepID=A0A9E6Q126_9PSED|nr:GNAT family N-acetyltransferase [Pseudomonas xantholysinigenes]QXI40437.1 GNAT family N-acetyltransferase [Pseudomonas xantholysinigenes]
MIRAATHDDIPRLVELGTLLHHTSSYAGTSFNPDKVGSFLGQLIDGLGVVFAAEVDGQVVGGFAGAITEQWFSDDLLAYDYSIFIEPGKRHGIIALKLILAFQNWATAKGVKEIHMGITTGMNVEGTSRLYKRLGFEYVGPLFKMEVEHGR